MSFDKAKHTRNAERFLSQGKIRAAIGEYKRIVENDPKDFSTLNMLGDLCVKERDTQEAVRCYKQVAEHYAKQGFAQKAIAIYNKISRLTPGSVEVSAKLAQLYQAKGSVAEARLHYSELAEHYQKKGQKAEALAVWKQIAELDPNNTDIYLKIAQMCCEQDLREDAAEAFAEAGARFAAKKHFEQAASAFSKSLEIKPSSLVALNGLVNAQIGMGDADEAAKALEAMLEKQPYNCEILNLLVSCYLDLNKAAEAERTAVKLFEQEPANYPIFLEVVKSYLKTNDLQSAARVLSITSEHLLVGGQGDELVRWANEILAKNPEQIEALRLLVRYHGWQRDEKELRQTLERMVEAARAAEAFDDERYALSQLILMAPQESSYPQRLQEINEQFGYTEAVFGETVAIAPTPLETVEVPVFENFMIAEGEPAGAERAEMYMEAYAEFKSEEYYGTGGDVFDYENIYSDEASNGFAFKNNSNAGAPIVVNDFQPAETAFTVGMLDEDVAARTFENAPLENETKIEAKQSDTAKLREELETVEYYFAQGYKDLAVRTLDSLAEQFGELPEIEKARVKYADAPQSETQAAAIPETHFEPAGETTVGAWTSGNFDIINEFRDELGFEEPSAAPAGDYETHYQTGVAYQEMGLMEEAIREYQEAVKLVSPNDGTKRFFHCCNLLGHCFMEKRMPNIALMWYRRGLETACLSDEELQGLRYEIANAYEAGGAPDKAREYFEQVYAVDVKYRDVSQRLNHLHARN